MPELTCTNYGLQHADDGGEPPLDFGIFGLYRLFGTHYNLEILVRLLVFKLLDALLKPFNLVLSPFSNSPLCFTVYIMRKKSSLVTSDVGRYRNRKMQETGWYIYEPYKQIGTYKRAAVPKVVVISKRNVP